MMIYLKTKTDDMTIPQLRRIICETIKWCETNVGTKKKRSPLTYKVSSKLDNNYGDYDIAKNIIRINPQVCGTVQNVVKVVLHEYCHMLQDLRGYNRKLKEKGYNNHPDEKEARQMENLYSSCWKDIKSLI